MRLNVGGGYRTFKGYKNIDIREECNPDFCGDFRDMEFEDVDAIRLMHVLEHFARDEVDRVLKVLNSWLKIGGYMLIETPDFEGICEEFKDRPYLMVKHTFAAQENEYDFHKDMWWEDKYREVLPKYGFKITKLEKIRSKRYDKPNIRVLVDKVSDANN